MGCDPYDDDEIKEAILLRERITKGDYSFHWARKFTGYGKLEKLRSKVGLGAWSHNYKLASRSVHADYSDVLSQLAMSEAKEELLLVGESNSGMSQPAQMTAIILTQITASFLTTYINDENSDIDYSNSLIFISLMGNYVEAVKSEFSKVES